MTAIVRKEFKFAKNDEIRISHKCKGTDSFIKWITS